MLTLDKIYHASNVLRGVIRNTDVIRSTSLTRASGAAELYLKTENLQHTGSFKLRGAYYKISQLALEQKQCGVIACSAGNHAQGVALAARNEQIPATICIPSTAPLSKVEATRSYGANVVLVDGVYDDAYQEACRIQQETGATFIHPFDDEYVIAGQGTIGLELLNQLPDLDAVIVPIGGGGLISGIAFAIKSLKPDCKIYGVQSAGAPSMVDSVAGEQIIQLDSVSTIADGIAVKRPGENTFALCQRYVDELATVTDDEVASAILALIEQQKMIAEGAGAVAVAAAMFRKFDLTDQKVACVVSGGNIDVNILSRVINKGLQKSGRMVGLRIELLDRPGQISRVTALIAQSGANVVSIHHDRVDEHIGVDTCYLDIVLETRDQAQIDQIRRTLQKNGYTIHG